MLSAVSSRPTSTTSDSDSIEAEKGGEVTNVRAAPSGKITFTVVKVKHSKPSTLFKSMRDVVSLREKPLGSPKVVAGTCIWDPFRWGWKDSCDHHYTAREGTNSHGERVPLPHHKDRDRNRPALAGDGFTPVARCEVEVCVALHEHSFRVQIANMCVISQWHLYIMNHMNVTSGTF